MAVEISLEGMDDPKIYKLIEGPFDGSTIRMAVDVFERPPLRIRFESSGVHDARGSQNDSYILKSTQDDSDLFYQHEKKTD